MKLFNLNDYELTVAEVHHDLPPETYKAGAGAEIKTARTA